MKSINESQQEFIIKKLVDNNYIYDFYANNLNFQARYNEMFKRIDIFHINKGMFPQGYITNNGILEAGIPFADKLFNLATNYLFSVDYLNSELPINEAPKTKRMKI